MCEGTWRKRKKPFLGFWFWEKIGVKSMFFRFWGIPECGFGKRNDVIILFLGG